MYQVSNNRQNTQALVIGAGPSGLVAAIELARQGWRVRIIEKKESRGEESKALGINPRTLQLLEACEVTPRLLDVGRRVVGASIHWEE